MAQFSHIAGNRTLDLLNTVEWRLDAARTEEDLTSYSRLLDWCEEANFVSVVERTELEEAARRSTNQAAAEVTALIDIREEAYEALVESSSLAARLLVGRYISQLSSAELRFSDGVWAWWDKEILLSTPRDRVMRSMFDLLRDGRLKHLHQCEDRACGWVFFDTSPRRNRRWCVSGDCGDRNRSRAYYARRMERIND